MDPMQATDLRGYYAASAPPAPPRLALRGNVTADVCVVGAGFTGLAAALELAKAGAKTIVLESQSVAFAASGRNGGQIHTGLRKDQDELEAWLGPVHAHDLWNLTEESKALLRSHVAEYGIDCALKSGLVIAAHNDAALKALRADTEHLAAHYGYTEARMMDAGETARALGTNAYPGARMDMGGGHLHPLAYARGMANAAEQAGAIIHEHSRALAYEEDGNRVIVKTAHGSVTAGKLILACDAFCGEIAPQLAPYIGHVESFIIATQPLSDALNESVLPCDAAVADTRHVLDYYRKSADQRMLFAGRESYWNIPKDVAALVGPRMRHVFPQLAKSKIQFGWHGTVGITRTRMPHMGQLSPRVLFAHGYSGQGVALANIGGKLMAEAALDNSERFNVFARVPAQKFPGGQILRKPLITAALLWFKLMDAL